ncbi:MAG TPA: hypothetical protein VKX28_18455 [Xanthobacteraceae bacterium]|nr:hypothetical protein [Xanthobacteraceae bacterium]
MRVHRKIQFALLLGLLAAAPPLARADNEPVIVVPGRPGVPVMMYGHDVSGAVIEGEWGLNRPGVVAPTVIMPYWPPPYQGIYEPAEPYFPMTGHKPPVGRLEIKPAPNRRLPRPAQRYYREWHSESEPSPATLPMPLSPPIIVAPQVTPMRRDAPPAPPHAP